MEISLPTAEEHRRAILRRERNKRYYAKQKEAGTRAKGFRPFVGVDGEGAGIDEHGRQQFKLLRAGDAELYYDGAPLTTEDCLDFILSLPDRRIYVGFFFNYDATMILRDLPPDRLQDMLKEREPGERRSQYTFWKEYAIDYRPRQYFRVARRVDRQSMKVVKESARTINEVGGFFQKSFVACLEEWKVCDDTTTASIARQKERRSSFDDIGKVERDYCASECDLLAKLMEAFRVVCNDADIMPRQWRGAGWISAKLHDQHKSRKRYVTMVDDGTGVEFKQVLTRPVDGHAIRAYYGGRFEITTIGEIEGPIYEQDINSAYPAAMLYLPCPIHTRWRRFYGNPPPTHMFYVSQIKFFHRHDAFICGFPVRFKGRLFWPREGQGTYWSPEINAAIDAGAHVDFRGGFIAERACDCEPFQWVRELFHLRRSIGKSTRGYPIKLGLNGLYGKLAQRMGNAPFRDYVAAGLITAIVRSWLIDAYTGDPEAVVMMATDGIFSRRPLPVRAGPELGQWEVKERPTGLFVVQPGIYWSPGTTEADSAMKTRGIPRSRIISRRDEIERNWRLWCNDMHDDPRPPTISIERDGAGQVITNFIGHRLALARNKPLLAGCWVPSPKTVSFDWKAKRHPAGEPVRGMVVTQPLAGRADLVSEVYDPKALTDIEAQAMEAEAMPDYEPVGNTGE